MDGLDWNTALRSDGIKKLVAAGHVDPSLFDVTEITAEELYPGERHDRGPQSDSGRRTGSQA